MRSAWAKRQKGGCDQPTDQETGWAWRHCELPYEFVSNSDWIAFLHDRFTLSERIAQKRCHGGIKGEDAKHGGKMASTFKRPTLI